MEAELAKLQKKIKKESKENTSELTAILRARQKVELVKVPLFIEMIAKEVDMIPDELVGNLGDVHLYSNHIEQAKEQITRKPMTLPVVEISELDLLKGNVELELKNYLHHAAIKAPLSN